MRSTQHNLLTCTRVKLSWADRNGGRIMFENLFTNPRTIARYRDEPLAEERLRYLVHCAAAGARDCTLRKIASHQMHVVHLLGLHAGERTSMARIEAAAREWARPGGRHSGRTASREARTRFVGQAVRWLRFAGLLEEPEAVRHAHAGEVAAWVAWMRQERGWAEETIRGCSATIDRFLRRLDAQGVDLATVRSSTIDQAIARYQARGCSRQTVRDYAQHLRAFFRFAERQAWCQPGLAEGIMPTRMQRGETIPQGLRRDEVVRLLATTAGKRPRDIRDRAILMVLITYGLRASEVSGLQLDNVDWAQETLRVRCPKPGRTHLYPLARSVGQALVRYLRRVRPARPERALFLTLSAPLRPVSRSAITHVVRSRLARAGVSGKRRGAHALRHTAAQRLLDEGLSMKQVGDYLGHRSVAATAIYAKVRLAALREVAAIDLEGLA